MVVPREFPAHGSFVIVSRFVMKQTGEPLTAIVYSLENCVQCVATKRALSVAGVPYEEVDLATDDAAAEHMRELGHRQAPVVVTPEGEHWSGFQPDRIAALVAA